MQHGTGYETLLYDRMTGDATLFKREDNVLSGWRTVQPILDAWEKINRRIFKLYFRWKWSGGG